MTTPAKAETTDTTKNATFFKSALTDALQLALVLEYLENEYYALGLAASLIFQVQTEWYLCRFQNMNLHT
jgi:hypothetical protein